MITRDMHFAGCEAVRCGRVVLDRLVSSEEVSQLIAIAEKGMSLGGGAGGVNLQYIFLIVFEKCRR